MREFRHWGEKSLRFYIYNAIAIIISIEEESLNLQNGLLLVLRFAPRKETKQW